MRRDTARLSCASWMPLILALLVGFYLRTHLLAAQELWGDEAMSSCVAQMPLRQAVAPRVDTHPPLYYVILHLWARLAGMGLFALRFVSVGLSLPMIALAYRLGDHLVDRRAGLLAAWLMALSPLQVYYAQEMRMYALVAVLGMASMLCLVRLLQAPRPTLWAGYWAVTLGAMYAHYQAFPLIAAQNLVALLCWMRQPRRLWTWLAGMLGLAVAYLPWVLNQVRYLGEHSSGKPYGLVPARLATIIRQGLRTYVVGSTAPQGIALAGVLLGLLLAGVGVLSLRRRPHSLALLLAWLSLSLGLWWLADPLMPFFHPRFVMAGAPALLLLAAAGVAWVAGHTRPGALALACLAAAAPLVALHGWYTDPAHKKGDYGAALAHIAGQAQPGDIIILNNAEQRCLFDYYRPAGLPWAMLTPADTLTPEAAHEALRRLTEGYERVWLIAFGHAEVFDPQHNAEKWLAAHGHWAYYQSHQGFYVHMYVLGEPPQAPPVPLAVGFADHIRLLGYDLRPQPVPAGGALLVTLYWQADAQPAADYTVFAQILDAQGALVAQLDGQPAGGARPTSHWRQDEIITDPRAIPIPADLAPGAYSLWVGLYTWPDMVRLKLAGTPADAFLVAQVAVQ